MSPKSVPEGEAANLHELMRNEILDALAENEFGDFTFLAAQICGTPIALASLIAGERLWLKSCYGLDAEETPREVSFCAHTILGRVRWTRLMRQFGGLAKVDRVGF